MKYFLATLAIVGSVLAFPMQEDETYSTTSAVMSTPSSTPVWSSSMMSSTPVSSTPVSSTPYVSSTPVSSTFKVSSTPYVSSTSEPSATPTCSVDSDGDNGNHYGWCKKAQHSGTYKNGKSDGGDE